MYMADGPTNLQISSPKGQVVFLSNKHATVFGPCPIKSSPTVVAHRLILLFVMNTHANDQALDLHTPEGIA